MSSDRPPFFTSRRRFLANTLAGAGMLAAGGQVLAGVNQATRSLAGARDTAGREKFFAALGGGLQPPDANGVRLPAGFTSRIVARSSQIPAPGTSYAWHAAPDGGAAYATEDGGWVYACNSELDAGVSGVGALKFDAAGNVVDAFPILTGTNRNCAGGPTPWNTWLSCEEHEQGLVWECNPFSAGQGIARPALGTFSHEAAAVDPVGRRLYLTEDTGDSCLYRFTPQKYPDLSVGVLEVAQVLGDPLTGRRRVIWQNVPNPNPAEGDTPTRNQVEGVYRFNRGEGMYYHDGVVYFTTTGDDRVWTYRTRDDAIEVFYDAALIPDAPLHDPDNVLVDSRGFVYVAEDSDDLQVVLITPEGVPMPFVQLVGHDDSEITGPAFSPDGTRFYFNSQRGTTGDSADGITFEIVGPFPSIDLVFAGGFETRPND